MIAGTINIELAANVARIQQDMERARRVVDDATTRMGRAAGMAKSALGAIAGVLSVAAFATWIKGAIDAADAAGKMSAKTGIAVKDLAGLQLAFDLGGAGAENIVSAMAKLNKAASENSSSLKALGVNTKALGTDGKALLYSVADAFAKMEDGAQKTAIAIEIFGKSGADIIPLLNDGSEGMRKMDEMARKLGLSISEEAAEAAGAFNDNLDMLMLGGTGVAQQIAGEMLPTLSSLSGSFLESMTSGDKLSRTADVIGTGLKILYTIAVGIVEIFSTVGKVLGGIAAMIQGQFTGAINVLTKVAQGDLTGAWNAAKETVVSVGTTVLDVARDVGDSWSATGKQFSNVWSGAGDKAFEEAARARAAAAISAEARKKAEAAVEAAAKKSKAAAEAANKARQSYLAGISKEVAELGLSTTAIKLREGAALGLGEAELKVVAAMLAKRDAFAEQKKQDEESKKAMEKAIADSDAIIDAINDEAKSLQLKIKTYGMVPEAITRVKIAELEAAKQSSVLAEAGIADIQRRIDALQALADEQGNSARQDTEQKAIDDSLKAQVSMWQSVEDTAHDTFISIFDSGKSAFDRLKDTLKNGLLDMLYQMTIKKWIFNIQAAVTGGSVGGLAQAANVTPSNETGIAGMIASAKQAYTAISTGFQSISTSVANGVQTGMNATGLGATGAGNSAFASGAGTVAGVAAGAAVGIYGGRAISNGFAVGGGSGNSTVNAGTAIGAAVGSFIPILGTAIGAAIGGIIGGAANRLFGHKAKEFGDTTLNGSFGANGFAGTSDTAFFQKGGVFRSDKRGVDKVGIDATTAQQFSAGYDILKTASSDFASVLGINAEALKTRSQSLSIKLGKDQAENQKAVGTFFTGVADNIAKELLPSISQFALKSKEFGGATESASATLQRIAGNYAFVDVALDAIGKTFGAVGANSIAARERLVELSGGLESLGQGTAFFAQNFLSEAERLAPVAVKLKASLANMGLAFVDTREEFRSIVLGLDLTTESGAKTYASLMGIQEMFAAVVPAVEATNDAMGDAKAAQDAMRASLGDVISRMRSFGDAARSLKDNLLTGSLSTLTPEQQEAELRRQYESTKAAAFGGDEKARSNFSSIATAYLTASQKLNGGDSTYSTALAGVIRDADAIAQWSDSQIDVAQASLNAQEAQLAVLTQMNSTMGAIATGVAPGGPDALVGVPDYRRMGTTDMVPLVAEIRTLNAKLDVQTAELAGLRKDQAAQTGELIGSNAQVTMMAARLGVDGMEDAMTSQTWQRKNRVELA